MLARQEAAIKEGCWEEEVVVPDWSSGLSPPHPGPFLPYAEFGVQAETQCSGTVFSTHPLEADRRMVTQWPSPQLDPSENTL